MVFKEWFLSELTGELYQTQVFRYHTERFSGLMSVLLKKFSVKTSKYSKMLMKDLKKACID